jgi:hypothetical protein
MIANIVRVTVLPRGATGGECQRAHMLFLMEIYDEAKYG